MKTQISLVPAALLVLLPLQQQASLAQDPQPVAAQDAGRPQFRERWDAYLKAVRDPKAIAGIGGEAVFDRIFHVDGCQMGPSCLPVGFGNSVAKRTTRLAIELGASTLLGEDLHRTPSGRKGFYARSLYALTHAPLARHEGAWRPAYSRFTATLASTVASAAWRGRPLTASLIEQAAAWSIIDFSVDAWLTEFDPELKRIQHLVLRKCRIESR